MSNELEGERLQPDRVSAEAWAEHLERYRFTAQFVRGRSVLDLACGFGFGTDVLLNAGAKSVVGGDVDFEALRYATGHYRGVPLGFALTDGQALPFRSGSFDACVSMGTLAHVPRPQSFIKEVWRVLRPGGLLLVSTPNRLVSDPGRPRTARPRNPHHFAEFAFPELRRLLGDSFRVSQYYGQMFEPAESLLTRGNVVSTFMRHPALPLFVLRNAGRFARRASGRSREQRDLRVSRYAVLPFEGGLLAGAEPLHMVLVCVRTRVQPEPQLGAR